jgi:hypothetical protein
MDENLRKLRQAAGEIIFWLCGFSIIVSSIDIITFVICNTEGHIKIYSHISDVSAALETIIIAFTIMLLFLINFARFVDWRDAGYPKTTKEV